MAQEISISENDRILIVAPHPDDECIGCGGIMLAYPEKCTIWVLTDGSLGCPQRSKDETAFVRQQEFLSEMEYLGIQKYHMFYVQDGQLSSSDQPYEDGMLNGFTKVFVTPELDQHEDHRTACKLISASLKRINSPAEVYQYEIASMLVNVTHYFDISSYVDEKEKLIKIHQSQINEFDYSTMSKSLNWFRAASLNINVNYAEAFTKLESGH